MDTDSPVKNATRGNLEAALISEVDQKGNRVKNGGICVRCMFNPYEYRVTKSNSFSQQPKHRSNSPQGLFVSCGPQTLSLSLYFDTYEKGEDVSERTRELWKFMNVKEGKQKQNRVQSEPPQVAFEWGVFRFISYITSMTQTFTLFQKDGTPVRAKVDVTFTQYIDQEDYEKQMPKPGTTFERVWRVVAGDRLDSIASEVYGDPVKWSLIAERNHIQNPLAVRPGQILQIPLE